MRELPVPGNVEQDQLLLAELSSAAFLHSVSDLNESLQGKTL